MTLLARRGVGHAQMDHVETTGCVIHWFSWQPTPYNDVLFRAIAERPRLPLTVHYRTGVVASHPWGTTLASGYTAVYYRTTFGIDWPSIWLAITQRRALFVIAGWDHPTTIVLATILRVLRRQFVLWTDTPDVDRKRPPVRAWLRASWLRWVFSGARRLWATGQPGVDALNAMGAPAHLLDSFPFWLDLDLFDRRRVGRDRPIGDPIRFLSSGRMKNSLKGHDIALKALAEATRGLDLSWEYVIAGTGEDVGPLRQLAEQLGISARVKFPGWVEPEELRALFCRSDVLVHPSPVLDPYPNAVLEGMAASLVVMGSDVCGSVLDRIRPGLNGFVHRAGDWKGLSAQIAEVLADPIRREAVGKRARETAELWPVSLAVAKVEDLACR